MPATLRCEDVPGTPDYRRLAGIPGIRVELRYATPDNFVGRDLYTPLDCAWLHRKAAEAHETRQLSKSRQHPPRPTTVVVAHAHNRVFATLKNFYSKARV